MPHLNKIVDFINTQLQEGPLKRRDIQRGVFYGLAKQVQMENKDEVNILQPYIFCNGKEIDPFINDTYPFQIYHRCVTTDYGVPAPNQQFGDQNSIIVERSTLLAVIFANSDSISITENDLAFQIANGLNINLSSEQIGDLPVMSIKCSPITANFKSRDVLKAEYGDVEFSIRPQDIFFSISYQVETIANKNCLTCVDC